MQNADKSSSGRTRLLKGTVAVQRNSADILAPPTPYSDRSAGSRIAIAIGGSSECCAVPPIPPIPAAPMITSVTPGDGFVDIGFDSERAMGYPFWTVLTTPLVGQPAVLPVSGQASPIRVTGLTNGLSYTFQLAKTTEAGRSSLSAPYGPVIPVGLPGAPIITSVTRGGSGELIVAFTAPASNGGSAITKYYYQVINGQAGLFNIDTPRSFTITGLTNGDEYGVSIVAQNAVGFGDLSNIEYGTPATVPGVPTSVSAAAGNGKITVLFSAPGSTGGSAITKYQYLVDNGEVWTDLGVTPASFDVSGPNGTLITVQVRAVNDVGPGASASDSATPILAPTIFPFTSSDTWIAPAGVTSVDYLVVGGGGGGGGGSGTGAGGGGGGGSVKGGTLFVVEGTSYTITVGAGGAAGAGSNSGAQNGAGGSSSTFSSITAAGGGFGYSHSAKNLSGFGKGGAGQNGDTPTIGGSGGNVRDGGANTDDGAGGGGGGAGSAGINSTSGDSDNTRGGAGGEGITSSISGPHVIYGAGGKGADEGRQAFIGIPSGTLNISGLPGTAGPANTGKGGGGGASHWLGNNGAPGGAGGSGIVILSYMAA